MEEEKAEISRHHLRITEKTQEECINILRDMPEAVLARVVGELKWLSFPLVVDGRTLTVSSDGHWKFVLGPDSNPASSATNSEPINVLIGDCDAEVRILAQHLNALNGISHSSERTNY